MRATVLADIADRIDAIGGALTRSLVPWLALAVRVWLAQAFLVEPLMSAMLGHRLSGPLENHWWSALAAQLVTSELGTAVQFACPLLLMSGLLARPAAAALLLQAALYPPWGEQPERQMLSCLLLIWLIVSGPGGLSLDRLIGPGGRSAALPGLTRVASLYDWLDRVAAPGLRLLLRLWIAVALAGGLLDMPAPWLPRMPGMLGDLPDALRLSASVLLVAGLATRPVALALLLLAPLAHVATVDDERLYWLLLLAVLVVEGGGWPALDRALLAQASAGRKPPRPDRPHVIIVGGGFGGVAAARGLRRADCRVTLIDRRNHHLFQPLLYQVATAGLSPADIATPIRGLFRGQPNLRVLLGEVSGVDPLAGQVRLGASSLAYDYLVLATGARHSYFGRDDWAAFAPGLKSIDDATFMRRRLLLAFEAAENADDPELRAAWLTFIIVGGGPTGVELAGAIAELARHGLEGEFRTIDPASARVILVQSAGRLLPAFAPSLSTSAAASLQRLGVEVRLNQRVDGVTDEAAIIDGVTLPARTVLWAAGVMASPAASWLGAAADRAGRVRVAADLGVPGFDSVFAVGDTAASEAWLGQSVPGLAPAAKQGGAYVAKVIARRIAGRLAPPPFRYRHFGNLATIGRQAAVAEFGPVRLRGAIAWWFWGAAHIAFLVGGRNRVSVVIEWVWAYLTFRRGTRLI